MTDEKKQEGGELIDLFAKRPKKQEAPKEEGEEYFRKIEEANKVKKEKLEKDRLAKNKRVTRDNNLK